MNARIWWIIIALLLVVIVVLTWLLFTTPAPAHTPIVATTTPSAANP